MREGGKLKNNGDCTETAISATNPVTKIKHTVSVVMMERGQGLQKGKDQAYLGNITERKTSQGILI